MHAFHCGNYIFIVIFLCSVCAGDIEISDDLAMNLYSSYRDAVLNDRETVSIRRQFQDKKFQIHIKKLQSVNGFKRHNLIIKEDDPKNPLIYIDNPLETKVPNAYLTYEEFKKELQDRVIRLRKEFVKPEHKSTTTRKLLSTTLTTQIKKDTKSVKVVKYKIRPKKIKLKVHVPIGSEIKVITNEPVHSGQDVGKKAQDLFFDATDKIEENTGVDNVMTENNFKASNNHTSILSNNDTTNATDATVSETDSEIDEVTTDINELGETTTETSLATETKSPEHKSGETYLTERYIVTNEPQELVTELLVTDTEKQEETDDVNDIPITESEKTVTEVKLFKRSRLSRPLVFMNGELPHHAAT